MAKDDSAAQAEKRNAEAQEALAKAQEAAAEAASGLAVTKTRNIPKMTVEVTPGNMIGHEGKFYYGEGYALAPDEHDGDTVVLDGPTAMNLMMLGMVRVKGEA